jgi:hypothetical protein
MWLVLLIYIMITVTSLKRTEKQMAALEEALRSDTLVK